MTDMSPPVLTVVVPCYNEAENIVPLVQSLRYALGELAWEVVFVDDNSPDGTAGVVRQKARKDARVRLIRRIGRRGLSSAVIEGALSSSAEVVAVMDGDLQHDETVLLHLALPLLKNQADIAVASRHIEGGSDLGLANGWRFTLSRTGVWLSRKFLRIKLSDPMSGFFAFRRDVFEKALPHMTGIGFKILLELVLHAPKNTRIIEKPFAFRPRQAGESKLNPLVLMQFVGMVAQWIFRGWLPTRFVIFALVGLFGIVVNIGVADIARRQGLSFEKGQLIGTATAILANFFLNNRITYADRPLRGRRWLPGLILFVVGSAVGAFGNIGVAQLLYETQGHWSRSSAAGALIGVVWNYAIASTLVWR